MIGSTQSNSKETLAELCIGILLYGLIGEAVIFAFFDSVGSISLGWWIGIAVAVASACHMWWGLDRALSLDEQSATKLIVTYNVLRYTVIAVFMALVMIFETGDPVAAMLGVFGLKAGAYLQPLVHKVNRRGR